jgi:predicted O-methyltransferase YrrM
MVQLLKQLFIRLPGVRRIAEQRTMLAAECDRLRSEIDTGQSALKAVEGERDKLRGDIDTARNALQAIEAERDELREVCRRLDDTCRRAERQRARLAKAREKPSVREKQLEAKLERLKARHGFVPPGHFYSPIPDLAEIAAREDEIFGAVPESIPAVDLHIDEQLDLLKRFSGFYRELPFTAEPTDGLRYHYENPAYSYSDAIMLYCMLRHLKPRRIIEIGSGYSSCVMLDTNERFLDGSIDMTFIEPYPKVLNGLLKGGDAERVRVIETPVQAVAPETFDVLGENDILFVDSTHVSKVGSDVNHIFFEVLPRLNKGVHVHFHDIAYPFEYPKRWVFAGRAWNETYLLRSFLSFNSHFRVLLMNTFLHQFHPDFFDRHMPLCTKNPGGSIWMRREAPA